MLLKVEAKSDLHNVLQWTPYKGYLGNPTTYAIYRKVDGVLNPLPIATVPAAQTNYIDDVNSLSATGGVFHYYVMALEGPGNSYGFADSARSNTMMALQKPRVYVPSAFNPGSSHTENQTFIPVGVFINSKDYLFQVYNRWGQLLFETTEINKGWDGTYKGEDAAQGVYTYFVRFTTSDGQLFEKRGTVTLIR
jgi:gliding motility-associated-like protein